MVLRAPSSPLALSLCLKSFIKCNFLQSTEDTLSRAQSCSSQAQIFLPRAQLSCSVTPWCIWHITGWIFHQPHSILCLMPLQSREFPWGLSLPFLLTQASPRNHSNRLHLLSLNRLFDPSQSVLMGIWHTLGIQAHWENDLRLFREVPMPANSSQFKGSPISACSTHCQTHAAGNFSFGKGKAWQRTARHGVQQYQPWHVLIPCKIEIQDGAGLVVYHPLFLSPTHVSIHLQWCHFSQA